VEKGKIQGKTKKNTECKDKMINDGVTLNAKSNNK
jgi:hypothetical protein